MLLGAYRVIYEQWNQLNDISKRRIEFSLKTALKTGSLGKEKMATDGQKRKTMKRPRQN